MSERDRERMFQSIRGTHDTKRGLRIFEKDSGYSWTWYPWTVQLHTTQFFFESEREIVVTSYVLVRMKGITCEFKCVHEKERERESLKARFEEKMWVWKLETCYKTNCKTEVSNIKVVSVCIETIESCRAT